MEDILIVFVFLICIGNRNCYIHRYNDSIFTFGEIKNYCDMMCGDTPHILCRDEEIVGPPPPKCSDNFHIFDFNESNLKDEAMMGLNGLRDRIADKMQVANMILLTWDDELSLMAQTFLARCKPFERNQCTNLGATEIEARESEPRYYHIADNVAFRKNKFFPYHFVPSVLRDWYYEKNNVRPPRIYKSEYSELYGILKGHNNFTRLANPRLSRVGCSLARFHDGYALLCYFFPYFQTNIRFDRGSPASSCPNLFPLKGQIFPNLCTAGAVQCGLGIILVSTCTFTSIFWRNTYGYRMFRLRVQGGLIFWQKWNW